jgi:tetratricopeptide (TPR) repeat protein
VLKTLPETPERTRHELDLLTLLAPVLMATKGFAAVEVEHTYIRARELCQDVGETPQLFPVLSGLARLYYMRAQYETALELEEQLLSLASRQQEPLLLHEAHRRHGASLSALGELSAARTHLEHAMGFYDRHNRRPHDAVQDPGVACLSFLAWTLSALGYLDQALACNRQAVALALELSHPFSLAFATSHMVWTYQLRREVQAVQEQAKEAIHIATEQGFPLLSGFATILWGWARASQRQGEEEVA